MTQTLKRHPAKQTSRSNRGRPVQSKQGMGKPSTDQPGKGKPPSARKQPSSSTSGIRKPGRKLAQSQARHPANGPGPRPVLVQEAPKPASPKLVSPRYGLVFLLLLIISAFSLIGLLMVLSSAMVVDLESQGSTWFHFRKQFIWMGIGWVLLIVTSLVDYRKWAKLATPLLVGSLALLGLVLVPGFGVSVNGATRWLQLGPVVFQPAEIAKFALVIWLARFLANRHDKINDARLSVRPTILLLSLMALLILGQPSLGSTIVIAAIAFAMLLIAGSPIGSLLRWGALGTAGVIAVSYSADYRRQRLTSFLNPWDDPFGTDYQAIQSMVSIASGGVNGVGLGAGRAKWGYLPYSHTDFIFAVIAEELGFVGASLTICLFVLLGGIGMYVAMNAPSNFAMLLTIGFITWIVGQFFINICATIVLLPITGLPIPFLSFGGSALVFNMAAMGVIINIAKQCHKTSNKN